MLSPLLLNGKLPGDRKITLHIFLSSTTYYIGGNFLKKRKKKEETLPECVLCIRQMQDVSRWKDTITNLSSLPDF